MNPCDSPIHYLEIVSPDADAARRFYTEAFGWSFSTAQPELGFAFVAELPGGSRCGIRAPLSPQETPTVRSYLRVPDLVVATREAERLGATLLLDHMELPGWGQIAIYEIGGIQQGIWQLP